MPFIKLGYQRLICWVSFPMKLVMKLQNLFLPGQLPTPSAGSKVIIMTIAACCSRARWSCTEENTIVPHKRVSDYGACLSQFMALALTLDSCTCWMVDTLGWATACWVWGTAEGMAAEVGVAAPHLASGFCEEWLKYRLWNRPIILVKSLSAKLSALLTKLFVQQYRTKHLLRASLLDTLLGT